MTGFGFGKGSHLTDAQRAVHEIRADETLALRDRIAELEAALKPFADQCDTLVPDSWFVGPSTGITFAHLRAARAAYLGEKE